MNPHDIIKQLRKYPAVGMGVEDEFNKILKAIASAASAAGIAIPNVIEYGNAVSELMAPINELQNGLDSLIITQRNYNSEFLKTVKSSTLLLEREKELAKSLGMTAKSTALLSREYYTMTKNLNISKKSLDSYMIQLNKIAPGMLKNLAATGKYGEKLLETNDFLREHIGLSEEQTNNMVLASAAAGTDLETSVVNAGNLATAFGKLTGDTEAFADMMKAISDVSLDLRMEYSSYPGSLELAALKARSLGLTIDDINNASTSMLDIESSIGKEMQYQLVSGKRLVDASGNSLLNKMREAKMSGNILDQTNALNEILETQQSTLEGTNYYAKQALADVTGLTVAQLQAANAQKKLQEQIYEKMDVTRKAQFKSAMEIPMEDLQLEVQKLSGDEKAKAIETLKQQKSLQTPADRTAAALEKMLQDGIYLRVDKKGDFAAELTKSAEATKKSTDTFIKSMESFQKMDAEEYGKRQLIAQAATGYITVTKAYITTQPGGKAGLDALEKATAMLPSLTNLTGQKATGIGADDAFMMHDGVIKFDNRDKFTMIASPYGAMHDSVADKITGGNSKGIDTNALAKAIQTAIQAGLSNVSWAVNLDPMAVDKAIKFKSGRLN